MDIMNTLLLVLQFVVRAMFVLAGVNHGFRQEQSKS
jgi:hypothetical protein